MAAAEGLLTRVKQSNAYLPWKDRDRLSRYVEQSASQILDLSQLRIGNKGLESALRALILMAHQPSGSDVCACADLEGLVEAVCRVMLDSKCPPRVVPLCAACLCAWGVPLPHQVVEFDFAASNRPLCLEACACLLLHAGSLSDLSEQALTASVWATYVAVDKGKRFAPVQRFTWPLLQQLVDVSSVVPPSVGVALRKVREAVENVLTSTDVRKGHVLPDGSKMGSGDRWTSLCSPPAAQGFSEQQEVHAWVLSALPALLDEGLGEAALSYASLMLMQLGTYAARGVFPIAPSLGGCVGISFVEGSVVQLLQLLPRLVAVLPRAGQELDGEVMGLFFQLLAQTRKPSPIPTARAHRNLAGWTSDDSASRAMAQTAGARSEGIPHMWLITHVPHDFLCETAGDAVHVDEGAGQRGGAGPVWRGEVLLPFLDFFASCDSASEGAVVEALFTAPHWCYYIQSHLFGHSLFRYLSCHLHRDVFSSLRESLHLKLLRITALSPHSHASSFARLLPRLVSRTTYLDLVHRILDLPLLAHLLGRPSCSVSGANASQAFAGGSGFAANLADALMDETPFATCDEGAYAVFWAGHRHSMEEWVAEIESRPLSRKAEVAAAHVPRLLRAFFALVSVEVECDPIMAVNVVSALLARHHMLALPLSCAREVRRLLLQQIYHLVSTAPQVLELVRDELVASVRQYHIGKRTHRCVHLTGAAAATLSQSLVNTLRLPTEPLSREPRQVSAIFGELHKALFDVLSTLYRRQAGGDTSDMYAASLSFYQLSGEATRPSRRQKRALHDQFEAGYTVWDAAESIDALCVALVTIAVHCPLYAAKAHGCCIAVARACKTGVLPHSMYRLACLQLMWLKSPARAAVSAIRPCPPRGTFPCRLDAVGTLHSLWPESVACVHTASADEAGVVGNYETNSTDTVSST